MEDNSRIIRTEYSEEMQKSFIDYAMSVIIARALPDVRDGLKPVQRRTLYDMHELGIRYDRPYRKSARIVGDTMGKYHPHGDSSIYDSLVVMSQDFKKGMPLIDGHGNFGNIEGDGAAAMRYTEARLQKVTQEAFLADLDKDVVDFMPNFDETEKEPTVLPVKIMPILSGKRLRRHRRGHGHQYPASQSGGSDRRHEGLYAGREYYHQGVDAVY